MTDEHLPNNASSDPPEQAGSDGVSEAELDAILADAASLSGDLARDVGTPETAETKADKSDAPAAPTGEVEENLDSQLNEVDHLLDVTASNLGAELSGEETPAQEASSSAEASPPAPAAGNNDIPDFMDEFTRPDRDAAKEIPSSDEPPPSPAAHTSTSGVVATGKIGTIGVGDAPQVAKGPSVAEPVEASKPGSDAGASKASGLAVERISPVLIHLCQRVAALLDALDKPVARVPQTMRRIIGWIALATLGTSLFVFLVSLF